MRDALLTTQGAVADQVVTTSLQDRLIVTAHRDGQQLTGELKVSSFQLHWSAERRVQGQAIIQISDPDGDLWPTDLTDPLAPAGSRLEITYQYGATGTRIPLGRWRIRRSIPNTPWRYVEIGGSPAFIPGAGSITVYADEETATLDLDRIDPAQRHTTVAVVGVGPIPPLTVLGEVGHLTRGEIPLAVHPEISDAPLRAVEYDENRLTTIARLLDQIDATYRLTGQGHLEIIPATGTPTDWEIKPGPDGTLINVSNTMNDADLINGVTSWVRTEDDQLLVGRAHLTTGPLAWGGPFGRVPTFRGANLATTQAQVNADAQTTLHRLTQTGDVHLTLQALAHPGLQPHDIVTLQTPSWPHMTPVTGRIVEMGLTATNGVISKTMNLTLAVPHSTLQNLRKNAQ